MFFSAFNLMFTVVFLLVIGTFLVAIIRGLTTWNRNNHAPRLTVEAKIVARRADVRRHTHPSGN